MFHVGHVLSLCNAGRLRLLHFPMLCSNCLLPTHIVFCAAFPDAVQLTADTDRDMRGGTTHLLSCVCQLARVTVAAPSAHHIFKASFLRPMASSSDSFSAGEFNAAMYTINVGSPWSEAEPGTKFADWWEQQFLDKAPNLEMGNSDQQLEWVTGMSNRAGVNGLMKPLKGLSEEGGSAASARQP